MVRVSRDASPADSSEGHRHTGSQRWLLPYADVVTLLFALFAYQYFLQAEHGGRLTPPPPAAPLVATPTPIPALPRPTTAPVEHLERQLKEALKGVNGRLFEIYREERGVILVLTDSPLLFASASSQIAPEGMQLLRKLLPAVREVRLQIEGHTDSQPLSHPLYKDNWELSVARASAVARALMEMGVPPDQMALMGFGARRPVSSNSEVEGRRRNRRVELIFQLPAGGQ